ncbi:MAG: hypothetical protein IPM46_14290 [Flavobacteriales bacterium]|nr:hypothetical protein [Flavobacteriales bacterium]
MAEHLRQRMAINDLHFTYRHLRRRLPVLAQRSPVPLGTLLSDQHKHDSAIMESLVAEALRIGQIPGPQLCEEARILIDDLHLAGMGRPESAARMLAIIEALQRVRALLARVWNQLLYTLPAGGMPEFHAEAMNAQEQVLRQYHDLGVLAQRLSNT